MQITLFILLWQFFFFFFWSYPSPLYFDVLTSKCNASMLKCARSKVSFRARISFWKLIIRHNWGQNGVVAGVELLLLGDFLDYLVHFSSYLKLQKDFIYLIPIFQIGNTSGYTKGLFTCSILASIVSILVSIVVILTSIEPILEKCGHLQVQ